MFQAQSARENVRAERDTIGFGFTSEWLTKSAQDF